MKTFIFLFSTLLMTVFGSATDKSNCLFVVSKVHPEHLSVYEAVGGDTVLLATYPVCVGKNKGQKQETGDCKTPESFPGEPFYIKQIQDASKWKHDFGDGRGKILAYGAWFLRLETPGFSGIGIHGSTGNRESIDLGRGSEGCVRMLDEDIMHLHDNYAVKGTTVIILPEGKGPLPFERRAMAARGIGEKDLPAISPVPKLCRQAEPGCPQDKVRYSRQELSAPPRVLSLLRRLLPR